MFDLHSWGILFCSRLLHSHKTHKPGKGTQWQPARLALTREPTQDHQAIALAIPLLLSRDMARRMAKGRVRGGTTGHWSWLVL
jgi:hypothetical protein